MNDVMSFGIHRFWKDYFIKTIAPVSGMKLVDVAGGTGKFEYFIIISIFSSKTYHILYHKYSLLRIVLINIYICTGLYWPAGQGDKCPVRSSLMKKKFQIE